MISNNSIAGIILAAGASRRMGQPKQSLPYRGHTLLSYVIQCVLASSCSPVLVVVGANADEVEPVIEKTPVNIVKNPEWNQGMSSSIRYGVQYIREHCLNVDGMIFFTCDQPCVSIGLIEQLIHRYTESNKTIIASHYGGKIGIPVLFSHEFCTDLIQLKGDVGAKSVIQKYPDQVTSVEFPKGKIDLDTFAEYQQFISEEDLDYCKRHQDFITGRVN